jgi:ABC-type dipeptide/oligopeptide/nickel transport system permease subunit
MHDVALSVVVGVLVGMAAGYVGEFLGLEYFGLPLLVGFCSSTAAVKAHAYLTKE